MTVDPDHRNTRRASCTDSFRGPIMRTHSSARVCSLSQPRRSRIARPRCIRLVAALATLAPVLSCGADSIPGPPPPVPRMSDPTLRP